MGKRRRSAWGQSKPAVARVDARTQREIESRFAAWERSSDAADLLRRMDNGGEGFEDPRDAVARAFSHASPSTE
jgi:hypothetical protein